MELFFWLTGTTLVIFGSAVAFGAPYLPVLKPQIITALELLELKPGQTIIDLGSGDGRFLLAAAQNGFSAVGYEINPILVLVSKFRTRKYRRQVTILWKNYWQVEWPKADAIFVFLISKYMKKLNNKVIQYKHRPIKLVSLGFQIPERKYQAQNNGVFLYKFP